MDENMHYCFYRSYYDELKKVKKLTELDRDQNIKENIRKKNEEIWNFKIKSNKNKEEQIGNTKFELKVCYPGLLAGIGILHEIGVKDEIKLGFQLDYTTGHPYIPGSSIKGMLRSIFREEKKIFVKEQLKQITKKEWSDRDLEQLEDFIFGGDESRESTKIEQDIFFDAQLINNSNLTVFEKEYITPHNEVLENPIPLMMLKINPGNKIRFQFDLKDTQFQNEKGIKKELKKAQKEILFKNIFLTFGVGAKTNVGFGVL